MERLFKKIIFDQGSDVSLLIRYECDARPLVIYCPTTNNLAAHRLSFRSQFLLVAFFSLLSQRSEYFISEFTRFFLYLNFIVSSSQGRGWTRLLKGKQIPVDLDTSRSWFGPKTRIYMLTTSVFVDLSLIRTWVMTMIVGKWDLFVTELSK